MSEALTLIANEIERVHKQHRADIDELAGELKALNSAVNEMAQTSAGGYKFAPAGAGRGALAKAIQSDEQLAALRERRTKSAIVTGDFSVPMLMKAAVVGDGGSSSGDTPFAVETTRYSGMANDRREALPLLALLPRLPVSTGTFEYIALDSTYVDEADYQLIQGTDKPETSLPTELMTATIATIAVTLPLSEQVLADSPALGMFVQSRLTYAALKKLESEIIAGAGGTGEIGGLLTKGTAFTQSSNSSDAEAIGEAIAHLQALGWQPGAVLLHPSVFQAIRAEKSALSGEYLAGGWANPAMPSMWGVPVVAVPGMAQSKAIVLDPAQCVILDRQNAMFEFGRVNAQFSQNMVTARAELRAGLMVSSPSAVQIVTL
ncbi:MAG: phage major capsid protein [Pseudomonadota bacterium]